MTSGPVNSYISRLGDAFEHLDGSKRDVPHAVALRYLADPRSPLLLVLPCTFSEPLTNARTEFNSALSQLEDARVEVQAAEIAELTLAEKTGEEAAANGSSVVGGEATVPAGAALPQLRLKLAAAEAKQKECGARFQQVWGEQSRFYAGPCLIQTRCGAGPQEHPYKVFVGEFASVQRVHILQPDDLHVWSPLAEAPGGPAVVLEENVMKRVWTQWCSWAEIR